MTMETDELLRQVTEVAGYKVLPPCVIYARIGQGGMGAVYRGHHLNLDIDVAVKCLKPSLVHDDPQFVARFRREGQSAARINHQNVIRVYDVAEDQGLHYLIMEMVQGETARQRVDRKGPLAVGEALQILFEAAQGLGAAHHLGIVHRDIKPDNLLISSKGQVKVADLGLAKPTLDRGGKSMLSSPNQIMGTPSYMPPEQWEGGPISPAADVWALGATLWFLLVGREAIVDDSPARIMSRIVMAPFPDIRQARGGLPADVAAVIAKATAKDPGERYLDANDLAEAIAALPTRRETLRDAAAGTTELRTLLSPPPVKNLEQIKRWLREDLRTRVQTTGGTEGAGVDTLLQDGPGGKTGTQVTPANGGTLVRSRGSWSVVAVLAMGAAAAGYVLLGRNRPEPLPKPEPRAIGQGGQTPIGPSQGGDERPPKDEPQRPKDGPAVDGPAPTPPTEPPQKKPEQGSPEPTPEPLQPLRTPEPAPFAEAERLAAEGKLEQALRATERAYANDATLPDRGRRLAQLHQRLARQLQSQGEGKLPEAEAELALASQLAAGEAALAASVDAEVAQLRAQMAAAADRALRIDDALPPQTASDDPQLRGSFRPPFRCDLLLGGELVIVTDGSFAAVRPLGADGSVRVAIRCNDNELPLPPRAVAFAPPPPPTPAIEFVGELAVLDQPDRSIGGLLATKDTNIAIDITLNVDEAQFELNGVPIEPGMRDVGKRRFVVIANRLEEGKNEVTLRVSRSGYESIERKLTLLRLTQAPQLSIEGGRTLKNWSKRRLPIRVSTSSEWIVGMTATVKDRTVDLVRESNTTTWKGEVELEAGASVVSILGRDYVGRELRDSLRVTATAPNIDGAQLVDPGSSNPRPLPRTGGFVRPGTRLLLLPPIPGAELLVDGKPVATEDGLDLAALLQEGVRTTLKLSRRTELGTSPPVDYPLQLDGTPPKLTNNPTTQTVGNNRVTCSGTWSDASGIATVVVNNVAASIRLDQDGRTGSWSASLNAPAAATKWRIVATDKAGNASETTIDVGPR